MSPPRAVMFDFDGVILDSAGLKNEAYATLLSDRPPEVVRRIREYSHRNGGVTRRDRFRHIFAEILGEPLPPHELGRLCAAFEEAVLDRVLAAPEITGARAFLERHHRERALFLISGTPLDELLMICRRRGYADFFRGIGGAPARKPEWIRRFLEEHALAPGEVVFVGDAITDLDAARECGLRFVGVGAGLAGAGEGLELIADLTELGARLGYSA